MELDDVIIVSISVILGVAVLTWLTVYYIQYTKNLEKYIFSFLIA